MSDAIRERLEADRASGALRPLEAYLREYPGRQPEVERAWHEVHAARPSSHALEPASRSVIELDALRDPGFARLTVEAPLGAGGMGEVLAVRDEVLRRQLAMKRVR